MKHPFDAAMELARVGESGFAGTTSPAYANMVGPFGGTTGAVLLNAAMLHPQRLGDPVALTVNFASPIAEGSFEIDARPVRTNRSTQHWTLQLAQGGAVTSTATAVLAQRRPTWSAAEAAIPEGIPPATALPRATTAGRPSWVQRYDMRYLEGEPVDFDAREQAHSNTRVWLRDDPPRPLDFPALAAICDCFFPRIFVRRRRLTPIGTVSLTCYFHADAAMLAAQGERHVLGIARALNYRSGYFDQAAEIWSDDGRLLASTQQLVYYRE